MEEVAQNTWIHVRPGMAPDETTSLPTRVPESNRAWGPRQSSFFRAAIVGPQSTLGSYPDDDGNKTCFYHIVSLNQILDANGILFCLRFGFGCWGYSCFLCSWS